ncbi:MAG: 16S rRNA (uracil(1498)-N(3))-methyltransferase [Phycisphaerales bacterium]|nr:16S rRNA (uracil(1498)-N(3))-methyltransferase [Phycisphaerales bacterium]
MTHHRVLIPSSVQAGATLDISGEEAHHALRVRRLAPGAVLELLDGEGAIALSVLEATDKRGKHDWHMRVRIDEVRHMPPPHPRLEVCASAPKGEASEQLVDQLSQAGAWSWSPLVCARTEVDPREGKLERLERHAREASKQCGRAWRLRVEPRITLDDALAEARGAPADDPCTLVLAHVSGTPYVPTGSRRIRLLVGPVGDFEEREIDAARRAGARIACFGEHVMRIETACLAAAAVILDHERRG